jgi:hypothetical protein
MIVLEIMVAACQKFTYNARPIRFRDQAITTFYCSSISGYTLILDVVTTASII